MSSKQFSVKHTISGLGRLEFAAEEGQWSPKAICELLEGTSNGHISHVNGHSRGCIGMGVDQECSRG